MDVINALVAGVPADHPVRLEAPDVTILASAVRGLAAVSVIPGYARLARLNLRELACPSAGAVKAREEKEKEKGEEKEKEKEEEKEEEEEKEGGGQAEEKAG
jgi:flagellar biosynthesis component FlhA